MTTDYGENFGSSPPTTYRPCPRTGRESGAATSTTRARRAGDSRAAETPDECQGFDRTGIDGACRQRSPRQGQLSSAEASTQRLHGPTAPTENSSPRGFRARRLSGSPPLPRDCQSVPVPLVWRPGELGPLPSSRRLLTDWQRVTVPCRSLQATVHLEATVHLTLTAREGH